MDTRIALLTGQEGIWIGQALEPESAAYVTAECVELVGPVDVALLATATTRALREAEVLRARIELIGQSAQQVLDGEEVAPPQLVKVADRAAALTWMSADAAQNIDITRGPLARHALVYVSANQVFWYLAAHHVALDGFAYTLLIQRAAELYGALSRANTPSDCPFSTLAATVRDEQAAASERANDRAFWLETLTNMPEPIALCGRLPGVVSKPRRVERTLSASTLDALDLARRQRGPSWAHVLTALFAGFLGAESDADELVLGLPVMARKGKVALRSPVMMMNIVPLRLTAGAGRSVRACAEEAGRTLGALLPHSTYRYEQLRRDLGRLGGERRLFGPVLNIMPFARTVQFGEAAGEVRGISAGPVEDLSLGVHPLPGRAGLRLTFDAHPRAYHEETLVRLADRFVAFVEQRASDTAQPMNPARDALVLLQGPALAESPRDVVARILGHAREQGERIALTQHGEQTSYRTLLLRAQGLADLLGAQGVGEGALVALALPRCRDAVVAMLAVLLRGAAYLPLDPDGPAERSAAILRDAQPQLLLGHRNTLDREQFAECARLSVDDVSPASALPEWRAPRGDLCAYVIYTSGSTGAPNGVQVGRAALSHFVSAARTRYGITRDDRVLQFAPLQFDASVEELFVPLTSGATVCLRSDDMVDSAARFLEQSAALQLSVLALPTAFFHELVYAVARSALSFPALVRTVIIGGEAALAERVAEFRTATHDRVRLLNTYGPTETTVVATAADLAGPEASAAGELPIGRPLPGMRALLQRRSDGTSELLIAGPQLALGYLHKPALTEQRFVLLPDHGRAYRTGDLVRLRDDGQLTFVGRVDDQLKISGQRIELREVETVLQACPGVREAVVVVRGGGQPRLHAHVVLAAQDGSLEQLREHARRHLLAAALPSSITLHDALPLSPTGKVDRKRLRDQPVESLALEQPANELEALVLALFREVLGTQQVGLEQDFFELGGQSLQSIQVATRLALRLGREVAGALLFQNPSVRALARALAGEEHGTRDVAEQVKRDAQLGALPAAGDGRGRAVLLTGANGFLGAQLLHQLLQGSDRDVVCLVRAASEHEAAERLREALRAQQLGELPARVHALPGDLSKPRLGLTEANFEALGARVGSVVHNGASVSLARGYASLRAVNVQATRTLIELIRRTRNGALHYVSTLATALGAEGTIAEQFVDHHQGLQDGYSQSKWASEQLLRAAREQGLTVKVYRLGRLVGALGTACVNGDDLVFRLLSAGLRVGALPLLGVREPWTPVDLIARAITANCFGQDDGAAVYNLAPRTLVALDDVMRWTAQAGHDVALCTPDEFRARLGAAADRVDPSTLAMLQSQSHRAIPSISAIDTNKAQALLTRAQLAWPRFGPAHLHSYLTTCSARGLIAAARAVKSEPSQTIRHAALQGDPCTPPSSK